MRTSILLALVTGALVTGSDNRRCCGGDAPLHDCGARGVAGSGRRRRPGRQRLLSDGAHERLGPHVPPVRIPGRLGRGRGPPGWEAQRGATTPLRSRPSRFGPARPRTRCSGSRTSRRSRRRAADRSPPTGSRSIRPARSPRPRSRSGSVRARRRGQCSCRSRRCSRGSGFPGIRSRGSESGL